MQTNWHILYTKSGIEQRVFQNLKAKKIDCYLPFTAAKTGSAYHNGHNKRPLFPNQVFVRCNELIAMELRHLPGVISIVYWLSKPAIVPDPEILAMKKFLQIHPFVTLEKMPINLRAVLTDAKAYQVRKDSVPGVSGSDTFKLHLPHLGHLLVAKFEKANLKIIAPVNSSKGLIVNYKDV